MCKCKKIIDLIVFSSYLLYLKKKISIYNSICVCVHRCHMPLGQCLMVSQCAVVSSTLPSPFIQPLVRSTSFIKYTKTYIINITNCLIIKITSMNGHQLQIDKLSTKKTSRHEMRVSVVCSIRKKLSFFDPINEANVSLCFHSLLQSSK